jgi:hypothetical protein
MTSDAINAPSGKTEKRMSEGIEALRDLKHYADAVGTLDRDEDASLLAVSLNVSISLAERIRRKHLRVRLDAHRAAVVARNDELGIPNCDHLARDPACRECNKQPKEKKR